MAAISTRRHSSIPVIFKISLSPPYPTSRLGASQMKENQVWASGNGAVVAGGQFVFGVVVEGVQCGCMVGYKVGNVVALGAVVGKMKLGVEFVGVYRGLSTEVGIVILVGIVVLVRGKEQSGKSQIGGLKLGKSGLGLCGFYPYPKHRTGIGGFGFQYLLMRLGSNQFQYHGHHQRRRRRWDLIPLIDPIGKKSCRGLRRTSSL
ncbi:hypothetical protein Dimus_038987 [Dionaea muscipula]